MQGLITPIVLTGGSGTRLWPVSRNAYPKQFLPLFDNRSTYQQALERVADPELFAQPLTITSEEFRFFVKQQADDMGYAPEIILEPIRRDTAPAIIAGALMVAERDPGALVLVTASDHLIGDTEAFRAACREGVRAAQEGYLVTFGIQPAGPKTSYGYISPGKEIFPGAHVVSKFVEKPDQATAERYLKEGYLWNSGNFLFRADVFLEEAKKYEPEMFEAVKKSLAEGKADSFGFMRLDAEAFARAPQKSVDYAVMERTDKAAMVIGNFKWSDVGTWEGLYHSVERDELGNAMRGEVVMLDTQGSLVHAERLTALVGVTDLIVVTTPDAVLVAPRERADDVKKLVELAAKSGHKEAREHRRMYRPWGYYETLEIDERFQVKCIVVTPGAKLSLQKHFHRAEHWTVVQGAAEVEINGETKLVHENESVYVPISAQHRLSNPGKIPLKLIEVQTGSYLGEDDIVRFDDIYDRKDKKE